MKLLVVLFAPILTGLSFLFPSTASASPCANGSLQSYILLGASGCTIDDKVFSNFSYVPSSLGPDPVTHLLPPEITFLSNPSADLVGVVPMDTPANPGLKFTGGWGIDGFDAPALNFTIGFTATVLPQGQLIKDKSLLLGDFSRTFGGGFFDFVRVQPGATPPPGFCTQPGCVLVTNLPPPAATQRFASLSFAPVQTIDGTLSGSASFGLIDTIQENFSETVPEPSTWLLLGSGLAGLAVWRRNKSA